jgi:two-component system sensor histidine kinase BaeS
MSIGAWIRRLNVRLALILGGVALLALLVSGLALRQILPEYFLRQAGDQARTAATATAILVQQRIDAEPQFALNREYRNTQLIQPAATFAANNLVHGTIEISYADGLLAARADPSEAARNIFLANGLLPDPEVQATPLRAQLDIDGGAVGTEDDIHIILVYTVSSPYTNRIATLNRVADALIGSGLVALAVAILIGILGAGVVTRPLARLRSITRRFSHGELDVRAPRFDTIEVDELGLQFNVMADRLSDSLRMLEADRDRLREFVADVSHELRTPIAALRTFTELQRDGEVDETQRREFLDRSREQINRLEWMSTNLLDLSRMDSGIFPLDFRTGDLRDPVRNVVEAMAEQAEQRGVALSFEVPAAPIMLRFDRERIVQLLSNLVGNALKFTPAGGEVVVAAREGPDEVVVDVRDSGPGIAPDELPHIFDRFFRGTNVGEARASGSGLGLAITRSLAEMHGGAVDVTSAPGQGSVFSVRLPRDAAEGQ